MFVLPVYRLEFTAEEKVFEWEAHGEDQLEALCKVLRWNGIETYTVRGDNSGEPWRNPSAAGGAV